MTIRELSRRRLIKSASGLLLLPSFQILSRATNFLARPAVGGGTCPADGSPSVAYAPTVNADQHFGLNTDHYYAGLLGWTDATARTICKLRFNLESVGTITGITYRAAVYTLTGNNLNTELGFGTITGASWTDSAVVIDMSANPAAYPGGSTPVALVLSRNDAPNVDASNYTKMNIRDTDASFTPGSFATWNSAKVIEYNPGANVDPVIGIYWLT